MGECWRARHMWGCCSGWCRIWCRALLCEWCVVKPPIVDLLCTRLAIDSHLWSNRCGYHAIRAPGQTSGNRLGPRADATAPSQPISSIQATPSVTLNPRRLRANSVKPIHQAPKCATGCASEHCSNRARAAKSDKQLFGMFGPLASLESTRAVTHPGPLGLGLKDSASTERRSTPGPDRIAIFP